MVTTVFCVLATQLLICFECVYHIAVVRVARRLLGGCQGVQGRCLIVYYHYDFLASNAQKNNNKEVRIVIYIYIYIYIYMCVYIIVIAFKFFIEWHKRAFIAG